MVSKVLVLKTLLFASVSKAIGQVTIWALFSSEVSLFVTYKEVQSFSFKFLKKKT